MKYSINEEWSFSWRSVDPFILELHRLKMITCAPLKNVDMEWIKMLWVVLGSLILVFVLEWSYDMIHISIGTFQPNESILSKEIQYCFTVCIINTSLMQKLLLPYSIKLLVYKLRWNFRNIKCVIDLFFDYFPMVHQNDNKFAYLCRQKLKLLMRKYQRAYNWTASLFM